MENARELLIMVDVVSKEKNIPKQEILNYIEDGIVTAIKKSFPQGSILNVDIDTENGQLNFWRLFKLVDTIENVENEMLKNEVDEEIVENGYVWEPLNINLTRQHFNVIKQITLQKIKNGSKQSFIDKMLDKKSQLFLGVIKLIKKDYSIIDYLGFDFILPRKNQLIKETLSIGQKVYFTLEKDKQNYIATRSSKQFLIELIKTEVPQIEEGEIEIVNCLRIPGIKSKILVKSNNFKLDPIKTCVGFKGAKAKSIQNLLNGENLDFIKFTDNKAELLIKLLHPISINKIIIDEDTHKIQITISSDDLKSTITKIQKNISLISDMLGYKIDVFSNIDWINTEENKEKSYIYYFSEGLSCDEELAKYIYDLGFTNLEEICYLNLSEEFDELDEETIIALKNNAKETINNQKLFQSLENKLELMLLGFNNIEINTLFNNKVYNNKDVSELSTYDLEDILPTIDNERAKNIIISSRKQYELLKETYL